METRLVSFRSLFTSFGPWRLGRRIRKAFSGGLGMTPAQAYAEIIAIKSLFPLFPDNGQIHPEWERVVTQHSVSGKNGHDVRC